MSMMDSLEYQHNKLLSICIPTYNRCEKLKENLITMIPKVSSYQVCFFISDNASKDKTEDVVKEMQSLYPYIVYSRNVNNEGFDRNLEKALKLSDTKYRWVMGDDDTIENIDISELIARISNQYDLIVLNYRHNNMPIEDKIYTDMDQLLFEKGAHMAYISSLIFSDQMVINGDFIKFYDTQFIHLGVMFKFLAKQDSRVFFLSSIIVTGLPNRHSSFSDKAFKFFIIDINALMKLLPDFYTKKGKHGVVRKIVTDHLGYIFFLLNARIYKEIDILKFFKYYKEILAAFPPLGVVAVFISSMTPIWLLKCMVKIWKLMKVRKINRKD